MKILLINNNPVVSRLTALSARKEDIEIDEVQEVTELTSYNYDIVFVDVDSWNEDVKSTIFSHINTQKRVLFYAQDDNEDLDLFDKGILKPFLPSEVSTVIRSVEESNALDDISNEMEEEKSMNVVEDVKEDATVTLASESINLESAEVKTDLMDELEKIDEEKVEEPLLSSAELEDDLFKETSKELNINVSDFASKNDKEELFELDLNDDKISLEDELFNAEEKTEKVLKDELLEFDLDNEKEINLDNENLFESKKDELEPEKNKLESKEEELLEELKVVATEEPKPEIETKVLDAEEIGTIKDILEDDTNEVMELEDLVAPSMAAAGISAMALSSDKLVASDEVVNEENIDKKKKKKSKKEKKIMVEDTESSDNLVNALSNLKVESLKELLAGATVTINIQFPKA